MAADRQLPRHRLHDQLGPALCDAGAIALHWAHAQRHQGSRRSHHALVEKGIEQLSKPNKMAKGWELGNLEKSSLKPFWKHFSIFVRGHYDAPLSVIIVIASITLNVLEPDTVATNVSTNVI